MNTNEIKSKKKKIKIHEISAIPDNYKKKNLLIQQVIRTFYSPGKAKLNIKRKYKKRMQFPGYNQSWAEYYLGY